jgi:hypothetical protein
MKSNQKNKINFAKILFEKFNFNLYLIELIFI